MDSAAIQAAYVQSAFAYIDVSGASVGRLQWNQGVEGQLHVHG